MNLNNLNEIKCVSKSNDVEDKTVSVKPAVIGGGDYTTKVTGKAESGHLYHLNGRTAFGIPASKSGTVNPIWVAVICIPPDNKRLYYVRGKRDRFGQKKES